MPPNLSSVSFGRKRYTPHKCGHYKHGHHEHGHFDFGHYERRRFERVGNAPEFNARIGHGSYQGFSTEVDHDC